MHPRLVPVHVLENFNGDGAIQIISRGVALRQICGGSGVMPNEVQREVAHEFGALDVVPQEFVEEFIFDGWGY